MKVDVMMLMGISEMCQGVYKGVFFKLSAFWIRRRPKKLDAREAGVECSMERIAGFTLAKLMRLPRWWGCRG